MTNTSVEITYICKQCKEGIRSESVTLEIPNHAYPMTCTGPIKFVMRFCSLDCLRIWTKRK